MDIPINFEGFEGRGLMLKTAGLFSGAKLFIDRAPVKGKRGNYVLRDNSGNEVEVKLKPSILDPIPKVEIAGRVLELARPLKWYEYVWMGLPIILVFSGGALGALFGIGAVYTNSRIFRSERGALSKYVITGVISISTALAVFVLVVVIRLLLGVSE